MSPRQLAAANAMVILLLHGGLGYVGLILTRRLGWPDVWVPAHTAWSRWGVPALLGIGLGLSFIAVDRAAALLHPLGPLPHPPFPTSLVASAVAGITEEVLFRLFLIPAGVWLVSRVLLGGGYEEPIFWSMALASAVAFAAAHLPSVAVLYGLAVPDLPPGLLGELLLLNGGLSLVAAQQLRTRGLLAAVGVHWWADVVWHVLWGLV